MKSLIDYINETFMNESSETKEIKFNFKDLEDAKETIESLEKMDNVTKTSDDEITVSVTANNADKLDSVVDILQQYAEKLRHSPKRSSSEQYAQKTIAFANTVSKLNDTIDSFTEEDNSEEDDKENKEDKEAE